MRALALVLLLGGSVGSSYPAYRDQNGTLGLRVEGIDLDEIGWASMACSGSGWPIHQRYTMTTSLGSLTTADNDDPGNWCDASTANVWATVPQGNYGTPGASDTSCP